MKVALKISGNRSWSVLLKTLLFFFIVSGTTVYNAYAQDSTATAPDSAASSVSGSDDGPSISNLTRNLAESAQELERIRNEEILSYVYMGLGFAVVIGIAWFTTILAKKRKKKEDEVRALRMQHHKPHHGKAHHHPKR